MQTYLPQSCQEVFTPNSDSLTPVLSPLPGVELITTNEYQKREDSQGLEHQKKNVIGVNREGTGEKEAKKVVGGRVGREGDC